MGCPIRRSYAARPESGTCSTHAAAGKRAGPSHRSALLANWSLVTPVLAGIQHEPAQALGQGCGLGDAAMDLHRRDLGATVGVASHIALGEHAGDDEAHDGQPRTALLVRYVAAARPDLVDAGAFSSVAGPRQGVPPGLGAIADADAMFWQSAARGDSQLRRCDKVRANASISRSRRRHGRRTRPIVRFGCPAAVIERRRHSARPCG